MNDTMFEVIKLLIATDQNVSMVMEEDSLAIKLDGWYKHGSVTIFTRGNMIVLKGRYGEIDSMDWEMSTPQDIIDWIATENFYQWDSYHNRDPKLYYSPDFAFIPILTRLKLIKTETKTYFVKA